MVPLSDILQLALQLLGFQIFDLQILFSVTELKKRIQEQQKWQNQGREREGRIWVNKGKQADSTSHAYVVGNIKLIKLQCSGGL